MSFQASFAVFLTDKHGKSITVVCESKRCKKLTRSVMNADVLALVNGFDEPYYVK